VTQQAVLSGNLWSRDGEVRHWQHGSHSFCVYEPLIEQQQVGEEIMSLTI
jgi:hypothetical protein